MDVVILVGSAENSHFIFGYLAFMKRRCYGVHFWNMDVGTWLTALRKLHGVRYPLTLGHDTLFCDLLLEIGLGEVFMAMFNVGTQLEN